MLIPIMGKELSHVQFRSLEEQLFRSMAVLFDQLQRQGVAQLVGSLLKNAGVPEAVAMDIIGHDSEVISRHYTHIESNAKRAALRKLPDLD
jgi:hypothetical protein